MSYCRWSSMNWMCDVYVYEDVAGGWTTHVASNRKLFPPIPDFPYGRFGWLGGEFDKETRRVVYPTPAKRVLAKVVFTIAVYWHRLHMGMLHLIPSKNIGLEHDGETFNDSSAAECADRLEYLRAMGYRVPQYAIKWLREEEPDNDGSPLHP